jgi:Zn-dependent peptidase ImmA (M78 family)/transcriptional regulator with XRE-family HTH domain
VAHLPGAQVEDVRRYRPLFDGERLRLARELRGLSRQELAQQAGGISGAAVSQFEQRRAVPSTRTLQLLTEVLRFPPAFFASDGRPMALEIPAFFRSVRAATARERNRARAFAEVTRLLVLALERYVEFPHMKIPASPLGAETPLEEVERVAAAVRRAMGFGATEPIPNVVSVIESHGGVCIRREFKTRGIDAFSVPYPDRPLVVLGADKGKRDRSRFDAAHELGHLVMHSSSLSGLTLKAGEEQAYRFAAAFLMPARGIRGELPVRADWPRLMGLKRYWGTSMASLLYRARVLGIMPEPVFDRAMRTLSAKGWRVDEPGDLGAPESPRLLHQAIGHVETMGHSFPDIAQGAGLPESELQVIARASGPTRPRLNL